MTKDAKQEVNTERGERGEKQRKKRRDNQEWNKDKLLQEAKGW